MKSLRTTVLILAFVLLSYCAMAQDNATYHVVYGVKYSIDGDSIATIYDQYTQQQEMVYAGALTASWTVQPNYMPSSFDTYCVDIQHDIPPMDFDVNIQTTADQTTNQATWSRVAWLYDTYAAPATKTSSAALQLAIWDVLFGNGDNNVTSGAGTGFFYVASANQNVINLANQYELSSVGKTDDNYLIRATDHGPNGNLKQDQIGPAAVTPEGSSLLLLAIGGLPLGLVALKKHRSDA